MADQAGSVVSPAAPAAPPNGAPQPVAAPQQPQNNGRRRLSDMQEGLEQANLRADQRALETEQRLARPDPRQTAPDALQAEELPAEGAEPEQPPEAEPAQALDAAQKAEQELFEQFKAWRETGEVPEAMDAMPLEWTDKNGNLVRETIGGLKERGMRLSDYHRGMGEVRQAMQGVQTVQRNVNQHFEQIRDPQYMLQDYEERGYNMEAVAELVGVRRREDRQHAQAAAILLAHELRSAGHQVNDNDPRLQRRFEDVMAARKQQRVVDAENRVLKRQNMQLAQVRQQQESQQMQQARGQQLHNSLVQLIPHAFKAAGVPNTQPNMEDLYRNLNAYVANLPNWDGNVRRQHVLEAAKMLREELDDRAQRQTQRMAPPKATARALPPGRQAQSGTAQPTQPARRRLSEMASDPKFGFGIG